MKEDVALDSTDEGLLDPDAIFIRMDFAAVIEQSRQVRKFITNYGFIARICG